MNRFCFSCDLKDDPQLIEKYERHHQKIWPEIEASIKEAGIEDMQIYRVSNRMFMIMDVNDSFSFEAKALADAANAKVQEWETLMWTYQQSVPFAKPGEKWVMMEQIFQL